MINQDKFGYKIYDSVFRKMLKYAKKLEEIGFQESYSKPNLLYYINERFSIFFITAAIKSKKMFVEQPNFSASENALLLSNFKGQSKKGGAVLLGVCGGRNSEGEDYSGNYMNAVVIAGLPYHLPTPRVKAKIFKVLSDLNLN